MKIKDFDSDKVKSDELFEKHAADMKFTQLWKSYEEEEGKILEEWAKIYRLLYGMYCASKTKTEVKEHHL